MDFPDICAGVRLEPIRAAAKSARPAYPLLILRARRRDQFSTIEIRRDPRHPRWRSAASLQRLVDEGLMSTKQPAAAVRNVEGGIHNYNERVTAFKPLAASADAELLDDPDEFSRVCRAYAQAHGYHARWIEKLACLWLINGRTDSALMNDYANCGAAGRKRSFTNDMPGPKQADGPEYEPLEAVPYSLADREKLSQLARKVTRRRCGVKLTHNELWSALRKKAVANELRPPSFSQAMSIFGEIQRARRGKQTTGLAHERYRHVRYATQEAEADSTELQIFTRTELDEAVRLRNPVYYKIIDAKWGYVPACYPSYEASSNDLLAELVYRALTGMQSVCEELGLPYSADDFPPYRPGNKLWVDHQELTSPRLNSALLTHLNWQVAFAIVGKGADKGVVEGNIGHDKKTLSRKFNAFFGKHAPSKVIESARRSTTLDRMALERELIRITYDWNHGFLPADRVPAEFLRTGRPATRVELYKWDLERHRELIRSSPPPHELAAILLPTCYYKVHAGKGIYVAGRYYTCDALVAAGLLKQHAKGATPQVEVAWHRGTTRFVWWVRGRNDLVRCNLHARQEDALGEMTVAEADDHMKSMPSVRKREQLRAVRREAGTSRPNNAGQRRQASTAAKKGHITRDKNRNAAAKKREIALQAHEDALRRFPELRPLHATSPAGGNRNTTFDGRLAEETGRLIAKQHANLEEDPP